MPAHLSSLSSIKEAIDRTLRRYQVDIDAFHKRAGIHDVLPENPDARYTGVQVIRIWNTATEMANDPFFPFEVGISIHPSNFHAVGHAWLASRTLRHALGRICRFNRMLSTGQQFSLSETETDLLLSFQSAHPRWPLQATDSSFTALVQLSRDITHEEFNVSSIEMTRPRPEFAPKLARYFRCPIKYSSDVNAVHFSLDVVDILLPRGNPAMALASDQVAETYIAQLDRHDVLANAKVVLTELLQDGAPTRVTLAQQLNLTDKTFARRLADSGSSFSNLLTSVREELAHSYLRQPSYTMTDITYLLGFADQSNFSRWFKRRAEITPSQYRAEQLNA